MSHNGEVRCKVPHPTDCSGGQKRFLHFASDFPHLIKCIRNSFLKHGFNTPVGRACPEVIKAAINEDKNIVTLKVMPKITKVHISPNNFEKMRVSYAFQLFSSDVLRGIYVYKEQITRQYGDPEPTVQLIKNLNELIKIMTSRMPVNGLQRESAESNFLKDFLTYLDDWEKCCPKEGFISKSTGNGLRVTLHTTLSLVDYLTKVNYKYLLTSRLSQDKLENLFGIIRQCNGCNDHPTPVEFLTIVECLSFYNLAHPPSRGGNTERFIIDALVKTCPSNNDKDAIIKLIDSFIENGNIENLSETVSAMNKSNEPHSDDRIIHYIAGYVVRKFKQQIKCKECETQLKGNRDSVINTYSSLTEVFDEGGLIYSSTHLFSFIQNLEYKFTTCFTINLLHRESISDLFQTLSNSTLNFIGCDNHKIELTKKLLKFYIITRLHFYVKGVNKTKFPKSEKLKFSKMSKCK